MRDVRGGTWGWRKGGRCLQEGGERWRSGAVERRDSGGEWKGREGRVSWTAVGVVGPEWRVADPKALS